MGRGRDAGSGVLTWRTHRLEIKADQTQYGRLGAPWGVAILLSLPLFFVFRKSSSSSTIRDKRGLEEGRIFQVWNFFPVGIKVEKGRSKLIIRDNTQAGDWPIYVKLKLS